MQFWLSSAAVHSIQWQPHARDCSVADIRYIWLIFSFIWCAFSYVLVQMTSFFSPVYLFRWITRNRGECALSSDRQRKRCGTIVNSLLNRINWNEKSGKRRKEENSIHERKIGNRYTTITMDRKKKKHNKQSISIQIKRNEMKWWFEKLHRLIVL